MQFCKNLSLVKGRLAWEMQKFTWLTFRMLIKKEKNYKKPRIDINSQSENIAVASGHCLAELIINELLAESAAELSWRRLGSDD